MADTVRLTVDGREVEVPRGATLREAALAAGVHTPTLCWHPQYPTGANCRACVVEVKGSRVLAPACTRAAEPGMEVRTDSERVRRARKTVLELLLSQVDLSAAPEALAYGEYYGADPDRFRLTAEPPRPRPPLADNPFFVRDYARCILCQRCTEACGTGVQFTFAISVVGRGAESSIGAGGTDRLPDSPCVFCGNCVGACPTGALMALPEYTARRQGAETRPKVTWTPATGRAEG